MRDNCYSFKEWIKIREQFHQGMGSLGASLPLKSKTKRKYHLTSVPQLNIDRGQSYQGTRRDDGNG